MSKEKTTNASKKSAPARVSKKLANTARKTSRASGSNPDRNAPDVESFMQSLDHPLKPVIEFLRRLIRGVSDTIHEGIKWNAPSFRTADYFATMNLRADRVWLILHTGAKVKATATDGIKLADPSNLLEWLAKDRAVVKFADLKDLRSKRAALEAIVRDWIKHV